MWNAGLDDSQAGIKIVVRNINNLRYADDTTLITEREEGPKWLLMRVKEESERAGLKVNIQKTKIIASGPITSWQTDGRKVNTMTDFIFLGSKITMDGDCSHKVKRVLLLGRKTMKNLDSTLKRTHITLPTKVHMVHMVKPMGLFFFSVLIYGYELGHKEGWASKNWFLPTVMLEKTLESPLDSKEIRAVRP